jgi:hypothetical protein
MLVGVDEPLSDEELAELEALTAAATPGPWVALLRTNTESEAPA